MKHTDNSQYKCWVCHGDELVLRKKANFTKEIDDSDFMITNARFGVTGTLYQCRRCGFLHCPDMPNVTPYYEAMVDHEYEMGRSERMLQAREIVDLVRPFKSSGEWFDVGAGSGMLLEAAMDAGFAAEGIEASHWLQEKARQRGLSVQLGTFPKDAADEKRYDVVTMIDVIEHVSYPAALLQKGRQLLKDDGIVVVVTPDVGSAFAKLLGWKWWHFRMAHIGYFDMATLSLLAENCGLRCVFSQRPSRHLSCGYLAERLHRYLPRWLRFMPPEWLGRKVVRLNLRDSLLCVYQKSGEK